MHTHGAFSSADRKRTQAERLDYQPEDLHPPSWFELEEFRSQRVAVEPYRADKSKRRKAEKRDLMVGLVEMNHWTYEEFPVRDNY